MPSYGTEAPRYYHGIPVDERDRRCVLTSETCIVDDQFYFVRGCLEIHVHHEAEPFSWGVWCSLSQANFEIFMQHIDAPKRAHIGPFFGWLSAALPLYPDTANLKTRLHLRDDGQRPFIELEPTEHPLAQEQRTGITIDRVAEIHAHFAHRSP
jgi:hypothetical protein